MEVAILGGCLRVCGYVIEKSDFSCVCAEFSEKSEFRCVRWFMSQKRTASCRCVRALVSLLERATDFRCMRWCDVENSHCSVCVC